MRHKALYGGWPSRDTEDGRDLIRTRSRFLTAGKTGKSLPSRMKGRVFLAVKRSWSLSLRSEKWLLLVTIPDASPLPYRSCTKPARRAEACRKQDYSHLCQ